MSYFQLTQMQHWFCEGDCTLKYGLLKFLICPLFKALQICLSPDSEREQSLQLSRELVLLLRGVGEQRWCPRVFSRWFRPTWWSSLNVFTQTSWWFFCFVFLKKQDLTTFHLRLELTVDLTFHAPALLLKSQVLPHAVWNELAQSGYKESVIAFRVFP